MEWLSSGFVTTIAFDDFLIYPSLVFLALMGYVGGKWLRAPRTKNCKVECFPSAEGKLGMHGQSCNAPEVVHKIRQARGRSASLRRECVALFGLARYFLEYVCSRTFGLFIVLGSTSASSHASHDSMGTSEQKKLEEINERSSRKRLQVTKQTQETSAMQRKGKRTKKPQTTKPTFETSSVTDHVSPVISEQPDSQENDAHVVGGHDEKCSVSMEAHPDQEMSDSREWHSTIEGAPCGEVYLEQQDANDHAECQSAIAEASCDTLHEDGCDSIDTQSVSVENLLSDETQSTHSSNDNHLAAQGDSDSQLLAAQADSDSQKASPASDSTPDILYPPEQDHGLGSIDESREEVAIVPVPEAPKGHIPVAFEMHCQNSITTFRSGSSTLVNPDGHVESTSMYCEEPSCASTVSLYSGGTNSLSSHSASWHAGDMLMSNSCSGMAPYAMSSFREDPLGQHVDAASLADWTHHDYSNDVFSLVDPGYEDWQVDLSHQQFINEVVDDYYFGDPNANMIFDNSADYWGAYCGEDHAEALGYDADVFHEFEMTPMQQPLCQAASWVDDDEKEGPPPDIVLGDRENEYINLQLIAEMGDWCVLKELVGEHAGVPFFWNRSTAQRTWRMPQIMEETGLADALKSYAQRLPPPDHDASFRRRQVRAIRLTHGQSEKTDRLRSRRRTSHHIESLAHWPDDKENSNTIVPDFLLTDEAFPTLKKSFEPSHSLDK